MTMIWAEAMQLADTIAASPDAVAWHASAAVAPPGPGYAVVMRQHGHHALHDLRSRAEFAALCDRLMAAEH